MKVARSSGGASDTQKPSDLASQHSGGVDLVVLLPQKRAAPMVEDECTMSAVNRGDSGMDSAGTRR